MSAAQVSIRLGVEGKAEVRRAFEEVGQAGQTALGTVEAALDRAGAATDRETARLKRLAEAARLAGEAEAAQRRFNTVLGVDRPPPASARQSAEVFEAAAKEAAEFEGRAAALRAQIDPLGAAQARLNAELAGYQALANRGAITTAELAAGQALARQRFEATEKAVKGVGGATGLTRQQLLTLQYTFNDVVASLGSGISPMTILLQQGGQVTQAFGGLRGTIATLGSSIGVVGGVIAGVAVVVAGLTAAWVAHDTSTRAVQTALAGIGRTSGATASELERVAQTSAETGKVSVAAAREIQVAFLRTGRVGAEEMGRAIALARNYAATVGVETKAGVDELAKALADPVRGADELNARLSFLDDRTRQYVRTLAEQNDRSGAQRAILAALVPALADAEQATNAFGRAWNYVARQAANAHDAVGRAVDRVVVGRTPAEELDLLRYQRDRLQENGRQAGFVPLALPAVERRIGELEAQLRAQEERARKIAAEARANELSVRAGEVARDVVPGARELERLLQQQRALRAALDDPLARGKLADVAQVEVAYRRVTEAIATFRPTAEDATRSTETLTSATEVSIRATLGLAEAYLQSAESAERAEARRTALVEAAREGIEVEARARQALRERVAEAAASGAKQVADLGSQADAQRRVNEAAARGAIVSSQAQQALQVEQALRPLLTAQALAEGEARDALARVIDRLREAYGRLHAEESRAQTLSATEEKRREIELLQRQIALVDASVARRGEALAVLRAEQELRRRGVDLASEEARAYVEASRQAEALNRTLTGKQALDTRRDEIALLERQIALIGASVAKRTEELAVLRATQQLRQQNIDAGSPEGRQALADARRVADLTRTLAGKEALRDQQDEIALLEKQISLTGQSTSERNVVIAQLRAEQGLRQRGIDLASAEGQAIVANAGKIEQMTQALQRQNAAFSALESAGSSALDKFGEVIAQGKTDWKSWADAGRAALLDINRELVKLAITNPIKNFLFGSNQPTLADSGGFFNRLFGSFGVPNLFGSGGSGGGLSLFGGGSGGGSGSSMFSGIYHAGGLVGAGGIGRMMPVLAFAGAPRLHEGAYLRPDEVPAILQRGERVLNRAEARAFEAGRGAAGPPMALTFNVTTPDASSFRRAQSQITAEMAAALERARRNL
jgi:hypothetical protein